MAGSDRPATSSARLLEVPVELVKVQPEANAGVEAVGVATKDDDRSISGRTQSAAQAVDGDVEAVTRGLLG
jgi:hypothetical protein